MNFSKSGTNGDEDETDVDDRANADTSTDVDGSDTHRRTRRQIVRETFVSAAALGVGLGAAGTAGASGKGGNAAISKAEDESTAGNFRTDEAFEFDRRLGDDEVPFKRFTCDKGGQGIVLAGWWFSYVGEDTERKIYTRDNAIDTGETYTFNGKGTDCGGFFLAPFSKS